MVTKGRQRPFGFYGAGGIVCVHHFGNYSDAVKGLQRIDKSGTLLLIDGGK